MTKIHIIKIIDDEGNITYEEQVEMVLTNVDVEDIGDIFNDFDVDDNGYPGRATIDVEREWDEDYGPIYTYAVTVSNPKIRGIRKLDELKHFINRDLKDLGYKDLTFEEL